jgi:hypothetical protein
MLSVVTLAAANATGIAPALGGPADTTVTVVVTEETTVIDAATSVESIDAAASSGSAAAGGFARRGFAFPFGFAFADPFPDRFTFAIAPHPTPIRCLGERANRSAIGD